MRKQLQAQFIVILLFQWRFRSFVHFSARASFLFCAVLAAISDLPLMPQNKEEPKIFMFAKAFGESFGISKEFAEFN